VVEQPGRIRIVSGGRVLSTPFLDITDRVRSGGERGLLSVAFHPLYAQNGYFYVDYTDRNGDTRIERYSVTDDPNRSDPASAHLIVEIDQPYANHNGGLVMFGPDGMLYIGMGDGGAAGDPHNNGQNRATLLGDLLRIDVDHGATYTIPADNPYVRTRGVRPEIWAWGLRNPWRFCFDRAAGLLYIADVGQNKWEEVDVVSTKSKGLNFGWNIMEGDHCYRLPLCNRRGLVTPVLEYDHKQGCSITGGFVYRGRRIPFLAGCYLFSDYCSGWIRSFRYADGRATDLKEWDVGDVGNVTSFGEDASGELYVCTMDGRVMRLAAAR
jgi:glucose/arabinose dehydrogenase